MKSLLLALPLLGSCGMVTAVTEPVVDVVEKGAKPLTMFGALWAAAEFLAPVPTAVIGAAVVAFWETAEEEEQKEETVDREKERRKEDEQFMRDVIAASITGETAYLTQRSKWQEKAFYAFLIYYALRHLIFSGPKLWKFLRRNHQPVA